MTLRAVFIGDEVTAAGFRLVGMDVELPVPGRETQALESAVRRADLIVLTAPVAQRIPDQVLKAHLRHMQPLIIVLPKLAGEVEPANLAAQIRKRLGIGEQLGREETGG